MTHLPQLPPIGVIGLTELAQHCATLDLAVLTDADPAAAAASVTAAVTEHGPHPVIVGEAALAALGDTVLTLTSHTPVVVAVGEGVVSTPAGAAVVALPASVSTILAAAGITGLAPDADTLTVATGAATAPTADTEDTEERTDADTHERTDAQAPARRGTAVVAWSGKGGVGKSTYSLALAQRAASAGMRVALIDANYGQGDLRTFLRIGTAGLPSIYQAASGDLDAAFITAEELNVSRSLKLEPVTFDVVQAPPPHLADSEAITPQLYLNVVEHALARYDLVVIDTQIIESVDRTGMVTDFVVPLLLSGAHGMAVTDSSSPSISNLLTRLKVFEAAGIAPRQQAAVVNRVPRLAAEDIPGVAGVLSEHATYAGAVYSEESIPDATNRGRPIAGLPEISGVLDTVLRLVTGQPVTAPPAGTAAAAEPVTETPGESRPAPGSAEAPAPRKRGLFRRRR